MPKVSVVMPCYNVEKYIAASIETVLAQTFTDFELIIVDDGATDGSAEIYNSYDDPRIRVVKQKNRGLPGARNTGIRNARGEFIAILDSDDLWDPTKLAKHVDHLERRPSVGVTYSQSLLIDEEAKSLGIIQSPKLANISAEDVLCRNPVGNGSAPVFRAAVFRDIGYKAMKDGIEETWYFDESFRYSEDIECWMRIAVQTSWAFEGIGEPLTLYRVVNGGLSANTVKMYEYWSRMLAKVREYAPQLAALHGERARAYQVRYYARRAVKEGQGWTALRQAWEALKHHPRMALEEPRKTLITFAAALAVLLLPARGIQLIEQRLRG
jgi:glycosyltransferase involved in cell wall biosynthesis